MAAPAATSVVQQAGTPGGAVGTPGIPSGRPSLKSSSSLKFICPMFQTRVPTIGSFPAGMRQSASVSELDSVSQAQKDLLHELEHGRRAISPEADCGSPEPFAHRPLEGSISGMVAESPNQVRAVSVPRGWTNVRTVVRAVSQTGESGMQPRRSLGPVTNDLSSPLGQISSPGLQLPLQKIASLPLVKKNDPLCVEQLEARRSMGSTIGGIDMSSMRKLSLGTGSKESSGSLASMGDRKMSLKGLIQNTTPRLVGVAGMTKTTAGAPPPQTQSKSNSCSVGSGGHSGASSSSLGIVGTVRSSSRFIAPAGISHENTPNLGAQTLYPSEATVLNTGDATSTSEETASRSSAPHDPVSV